MASTQAAPLLDVLGSEFTESDRERPGEFKYLGTISGFMVSMLLLSNILSAAKLIALPFFPAVRLSGSAPVYPFVFLGGDMLTEVYGYSRTRRVIWAGFWMYLISAVLIWLVGIWPAAPEWGYQQEYDRVFTTVIRMHFAAFLSYLCGEFANSYVVAKSKVWMEKHHMGFRFALSTFVGQFVDSIIFFPLAFVGTLETDTLVRLVISSWLFKTGWEILFLPISVPLVRWLKRVEQADVVDRNTDFNPLHIR